MQAKHHHEESGGKLGGNRRCARTRGLQFLIDRLHQHPHPVEQIPSADAEHDRLWQCGRDEATHGPIQLQPATDHLVSLAPRGLVLILIALLYSVLIGAPELPPRLADRTTWESPCGSRRMLPASSLNVSPQYRSSRQFPLVTM